MQNANVKRSEHNQLQRRYYEERKVEENHRLAVEETPYIANHLDELVRRVGLQKDEAILDIGCGMDGEIYNSVVRTRI